MKKMLTVMLSLVMLLSFALAEDTEISLGALLYHESAALFDRDGINITITSIKQNGPEFFLKANCTNDNDQPVIIWFTLPNQTDKDPFFSFRLNGIDFMTSAQSIDDQGTYRSDLYIPAKGKTESATIIISPLEIPQDGVFMSYKDITEGSFCITGFMPTNAEQIEKGMPYWPVFFVYNPIRFNMSYEGGSPQIEAAIPPLDSFTEGTEIFSMSGVTLTCQDAAFDMDMSLFKPSLMGHAVLRNDTDNDFTIEIYDASVNGERNGAFTLSPSDGSSLFPAHSETLCDFSMPLNEGMAPDEYNSLSMVICCKDPTTGNNLLYQPIVLTVARP